MHPDLLLIGLDGGATKISGWTIHVDERRLSFRLGRSRAHKAYRDYPEFQSGFTPVDIQTQLSEMQAGRIKPTESERRQALAFTNACRDVIKDIVAQEGRRPVLMGLGMPGLKTADRRGIAALLNGPRIPHYADTVEFGLQALGIELAAPLQRLGSDADYCGLGEEYFSDGQFREVANAYYLGGGTGAADALKLHGKLVPLDETRDWLAKTWELKNDQEISLERFASAGGIQSVYSRYAKIPVEELNQRRIYPDQILKLALTGEFAAAETMADVSHYLALLLGERITTLWSGWKGQFEFVNPQRAPLSSTHVYTGTLLDRIILGQRLGDLLTSSRNTPFLWQPLLEKLAQLIQTSRNLTDNARAHYLEQGSLKPNLLVCSGLRAAPVLGAGIDAWLTFTGNP